MNPCGDIAARLGALLDGELPEAERREAEEHLAACPACRAYLAELAAVGAAVRSLDAPAPAGFTDRVMARVREAGPARTIRFRWRRWAVAAACCALAALGAFLLWRGGGQPEDVPAAMMARSGVPVAVLPVPAADPGVLTTGSPQAAAWVEATLGAAWVPGEQYGLTMEQYAELRQLLEEAGEPFTESPGGTEYVLTAERAVP